MKPIAHPTPPETPDLYPGRKASLAPPRCRPLGTRRMPRRSRRQRRAMDGTPGVGPRGLRLLLCLSIIMGSVPSQGALIKKEFNQKTASSYCGVSLSGNESATDPYSAMTQRSKLAQASPLYFADKTGLSFESYLHDCFSEEQFLNQLHFTKVPTPPPRFSA